MLDALRMQLIMVELALLAMAAPEEVASDWSGTAGIGVVWLTGNSDLIGITGTTVLEYEGERWAATIEADGAYEKERAERGEERMISAAAIDGFVRPEYHFSSLFGIYVLAGGEVDRLGSLEGRVDAEAGIELTPFNVKAEDEKRLLLRIYLGAHFARDFRKQFYPVEMDLEDVNAWGPAVQLKLHLELIEDVKLNEYASVVVDVVDGVRAIVESTTVLAVWMTSTFAMTVNLNVDVDTDPPLETKTTDTALTVGVEVSI